MLQYGLLPPVLFPPEIGALGMAGMLTGFGAMGGVDELFPPVIGAVGSAGMLDGAGAT